MEIVFGRNCGVFMKSGIILFWIFLFVPILNLFGVNSGPQYRDKIVDYIADEYIPPSLSIGDPEKYYYPIALARFTKYGIQDSIANKYVSLLTERGVFHFASIGLVRILYDFRMAPAVQSRLQEILSHQLEGNLWESEGTENHLNMERTSGFLIAQAALELLPQKTELAVKRYGQMRNWILTWGNRFLKYGEGEWNSSIYQAYSIVGWLNLLDFAKDKEISTLAEKVVNAYVEELAVHYSWGVIGGAEMRGKGVVPNNSNWEASDYFCCLWFGRDNTGDLSISGSGAILAIHPILSDYKPSLEIVEKARKEKVQYPYMIKDTRPSYLYEDTAYVKRSFYVDKNYTLGAFISEYGGYTGACSQIVPWKLVIKNRTQMPYQIIGNGCYYNEWSGKGRAPYTQWAQYKNILCMLTSVPENVLDLENLVDSTVNEWKRCWRRDYDMRFPGNYKPNVVNRADRKSINLDNSCFVSLPDQPYLLKDHLLVQPLSEVYVVVRFINKPQVVSLEKWDGRLLWIDKALRGELCGCVVEVIPKESEIETLYTVLKSKVFLVKNKSLVYETYLGDVIEVSMGDTGSFMEPLFDWGYGVVETKALQASPPMVQPEWIQRKGFGKVPSIRIKKSTKKF